MAELSRVAGLELVERDQLAAAVKELELSAILGANGGADRLKLGRVVKADALLLLSLDKSTQQGPTQQGQQRNLQVVISDCRFGARLLVMKVPFAPDKVQPLIAQTSDLVKRTRERFGDGIKCLIGVTPLKSKNASLQYDYLQTGYAGLLSVALMGYDGVAVLEMEEAAAIGRELELAGAELERRTVPLFVQGEFKITGPAEDPGPTVAISLEARDARQTRRKFDKQGTMPQVAAWLAGTVAREMLQLVGKDPGKPLSHDEQFKLLVQRGEVFAQVGAGGPAAELHQAALLLKPDHKDLRIELAADYRQLPPNDRRWEAACRQVSIPLAKDGAPGPVERWRVQLAMVEDVVVRGAVNASEVWAMISALERNAREIRHEMQSERGIRGQSAPEFGPETSEALIATLSRILPLYDRLDHRHAGGGLHAAVTRFRGYGPAFGELQLPPQLSGFTWRYNGVTQILNSGELQATYQRNSSASLDLLLATYQRNSSAKLDLLHWFLTEVTGRDTQLNPAMIYLVARTDLLEPKSYPGLPRVTVDEHRQICERLSRSGQPLNEWYGQLGLITYRAFGTRDAKVSTGMLDEFDKLCESTKMFTKGLDDHWPASYEKLNVRIERVLLNLRGAILKKLQPQAVQPARPLATKTHPPVQARLIPLTGAAEAAAKSRISFHAVDGVQTEWTSVLKCSGELDLMWRMDAVFRMAKAGKVEKIYEAKTPDRHIRKVQWDGRYIWLAQPARVSVCTADGQLVAEFSANEGLPEATSMFLQPIAPGRCLIVGRNDEPRRVWIVHVHRAPNDFQAKFELDEIHIAAKGVIPIASPMMEDDSQQVFHPTGVALYVHPSAPERRIVLVGRMMTGIYAPFMPSRPLAIDPDTLKVSVWKGGVPVYSPDSSVDTVVLGGRVLLYYSGGFYLFSPSGDDHAGNWERQALDVAKLSRGHGLPDTRPRFGTSERMPPPPTLLMHDRHIYLRSIRWFRYGHADGSLEMLHDEPLPADRHFCCYGVSAHYGMVGWNPSKPVSPGLPVDGRLWQIKVDSPDKEAAAATVDAKVQLSPKQLAAMQIIQQNGGSVGLVASDQEPRRLGALLGASWTGDEKAWSALADLDQLRCLNVVHAGVTDDDMRHIARCTELEELNLVESKVTDAGLEKLATLTKLRKLRIEGSVGGSEFSDRGLAHVAKLAQLNELCLYGRGFTDKGLEPLRGLSELKLLTAYDTATTTMGYAGIRRTNRNLRYDSHVSPPRVEAAKSAEPPKPRLAPPPTIEFQPSAQERAAVATIVNLGAVARPNDRGQVDRVVWYGAEDAGLAQLAGLKELRSLELEGKGITNAGLERLAKLPALETLHLQGTSITSEGLPHLDKFPRLRRLYVYGAAVTDTGLKTLAGMKRLNYLYIGGTSLGLKDVEWLKNARPDLKLEPRMEDEEAVALLKQQGVELQEHPDGIVHFASRINVDNAEAQMRLLGKLPYLTHLALPDRTTNDATLAHLKWVPQLKWLRFQNSDVTDAGLVHVVQVRELEDLDIFGSLVTDEGLMKLLPMPKLKTVFWTNSKVTREGANRFFEARQKQAAQGGGRPDSPLPTRPAPAKPPSP